MEGESGNDHSGATIKRGRQGELSNSDRDSVSAYAFGLTKERKLETIDFATSPLERFLQLILATGYLNEQKPLSAIVTAPPDQGKSYALERFADVENQYSINLGTKYGLLTEVVELLRRGRFLSHLLFPDFTGLLGGAPNVVKELRTLVLALTDEGLGLQASYYLRFSAQDFRAVLPWGNLKLGCVLAMTKRDLHDKRRKFTDDGFLSRFIAFSYHYSRDKQQQVFEDIVRGVPLLRFPSVTTTMTPRTDIAFDAEKYMNSPLARIKTNRWTVAMRTLLKASALTHGRDSVSTDDYAEVQFLSHYFNYKFNELTDTPWTDSVDSKDPFSAWDTE